MTPQIFRAVFLCIPSPFLAFVGDFEEANGDLGRTKFGNLDRLQLRLIDGRH
ncbi:hypothetical protein D9M70_601430 [compost metagenome]